MNYSEINKRCQNHGIFFYTEGATGLKMVKKLIITKGAEHMREEELLEKLGFHASPYALLSSMMTAAAIENAKLSDEEKAARKEARRKLSEQRARYAKIIKSICPDCEGKLIRGKKDKKNNYKRMWSCESCGILHSV